MKRTRQQPGVRRHRRCGSTMIEVAISLLILAALISLVARSLISLSAQRLALQRRQLAALEAANLMERILARPWDEVTPAHAGQWELPGPIVDRLPSAQLTVGVVPSEFRPEAKKVSIEISWTGRAGERVEPVRLVAWKYRLEEAP